MSSSSFISQAMKGKPVKLTWTQDDCIHSYFTRFSRATGSGSRARVKPLPGCTEVAPTNFIYFRPRQQARNAAELAWASSMCPFAIANLRIEIRKQKRIPVLLVSFRIQLSACFRHPGFCIRMAVCSRTRSKDFLLEPDRPATPY